MKKVFIVLGSALVIISVCMIVLVFRGASLRTEPIIKPSPIDSRYENISYGIIHRMFPSFQSIDFVVWYLDPEVTSESGKIFHLLQIEFTRKLNQKPNVLIISENDSSEVINNCLKPCWIVIKNELHKRKIPDEKYIEITFLNFDRGMKVPDYCENQQRLELSCILPLSVREVSKYIKSEKVRYFFMRRYNQHHYFLFLENSGALSIN